MPEIKEDMERLILVGLSILENYENKVGCDKVQGMAHGLVHMRRIWTRLIRVWISLLWEWNEDGKMPKVTHDGKYLEVIQRKCRHSWLRSVFAVEMFIEGRYVEGAKDKRVWVKWRTIENKCRVVSTLDSAGIWEVDMGLSVPAVGKNQI